MITFTFEGTSYQVEKGTTWREFVFSDAKHNGMSFDIDENNYVCWNDKYVALSTVSTRYKADEVITDNDFNSYFALSKDGIPV